MALKPASLTVLSLLAGVTAAQAEAGSLDALTFTLDEGSLLLDALAASAPAPLEASAGATTVRVHAFARTYVEAPSLQLEVPDAREEETATFQDATLRFLAGGPDVDDAPHLGLTLHDAKLLAHVGSETTVIASLASTLEGAPPEAKAPFLAQRIDEPHLFAVHDGMWSLQGDAELRIMGSTIRIEGPDGERVFDATTTRTLTTVTVRWVILELDDADLHAAPVRTPLRIAARDADARWEGAASLGGVPLLAGPGQASVAPRVDTEGQARLIVSPSPSTIASQRVATPRADAWPPSAAPWAALLVAGAALAGGATAYAVRIRRARPVQVEALLEQADAAAASGDLGAALDLVREARRLAPTSARLVMEEGYYLGRLGDVPGALDRLGEAAAASDDGEAELAATRILAELRDPAGAESWLVTALEKAPTLVAEVEADEGLLALTVRPCVQRAMALARRRTA